MSLRMEVRTIEGRILSDLSFDVQFSKGIEWSQRARLALEEFREFGHALAYSVHFLVEDHEIGAWSLHQDGLATTGWHERQGTLPGGAKLIGGRAMHMPVSSRRAVTRRGERSQR